MHPPAWSSAKVGRKVWIENRRRIQRKAEFSIPYLELSLIRAAMKYQARFQAEMRTVVGPVVVAAVDLQQLVGADVSN